MSGHDWRLGPGEFLIGLALLALLVAAALVCGRRLQARLLPGLQGPPACLAVAVFACATLVLVAQLAGLFGQFELSLYLLLLLILAAVARSPLLSRAGSAPAAPARPFRVGGSAPGIGRAWAAAAALIASVVVARALWTVAGAYDGGMSGFDTHWYHGPLTALFLQTGETFALHNSIAPQYLSWFYPHTSELLQAIFILPFDRDLLAPALNLLWLAGTMLAAWCIGRPFGRAPHSLIAASLILGSGLLADQPGDMRNDIPAVFFVSAAVAIAVNAWLPGADRGLATAAEGKGGGGRVGDPGGPVPGALIAIGLAAGLAAGTKLNYLATAGALVVALAMSLPVGRRLRGFGLLFGAAFLSGGYWYVRNLVHSGNPLPWITSVGPIDLPGPSQEIGGREGHGVIEYLLDVAVWRDWFLPGLREALTLAWPLILVAAIISTLLLMLRPGLSLGSRDRGHGEGDSPAAAAAAVHRNSPRTGFRAPMPLGMALALSILATVAAWLVAPAAAEGPTGEPVGFVSGLRYLAPALTLALALLPVALLPGAASATGSKRSAGSDDDETGSETAGAAARRSAPKRLPTLHRGLILALIVVCVGAGYSLQGRYLEDRYAAPDFATPGLNRAFAEASRTAPVPATTPPVAVTSTRIYAFFGPDLRRRVAYVGIPESHGGFRRPVGCREWRTAVNATGAETIVIAWDRIVPDQPELPPEAAWITADPAVTELSAGGGAVTLAIASELDPESCS